MKRRIPQGILVFTLVALLSCENPRTQSSGNALEKGLDSLIQVHLDSNRVAGLSIAVLKGDSMLLHKSYGYADLELKVAMPLEAIFGIGSMTKQFTAVAILQLVEQGKLSLDDDIRKHVSFDTRSNTVTIRNLLSHSSGIREFAGFPDFEKRARVAITPDSIVRLVEREKFDFPPGEAVLYSNTNYHLLGLILEKVSGMSYDEYFRINFFEKLGMRNSFVCNEQTIYENRVHGYQYANGLVHAPYLTNTWSYTSGSICSTVEDLIIWSSALHNGKILTDTYSELISPAILNNGTVTRYAKGLTVWESHNQKVISHGGKLFGFSSEGRYFPEQKLTVVTLMNTLGPVIPEEINDFAIDAVLGKVPSLADRPVGDLQRFCGIYEGPGKGTRMIVKITSADSSLVAQFGNGRLRPLHPKGEYRWTHERDVYSFTINDADITGLYVDRAHDFFVLKKMRDE